MSYMGGVGYLMRGSGLEELIETVYASRTLDHIMNGKAYDRALRVHMLVSTALIKHILDQRPQYLDDIGTEEIRSLHAHLMSGTATEEEILNNESAKKSLL